MQSVVYLYPAIVARYTMYTVIEKLQRTLFSLKSKRKYIRYPITKSAHFSLLVV